MPIPNSSVGVAFDELWQKGPFFPERGGRVHAQGTRHSDTFLLPIKKKTKNVSLRFPPCAAHPPPPQIYRLTSSPWEFRPCRFIPPPSHPTNPLYFFLSLQCVGGAQRGPRINASCLQMGSHRLGGGRVHFICLISNSEGGMTSERIMGSRQTRSAAVCEALSALWDASRLCTHTHTQARGQRVEPQLRLERNTYSGRG